MIVFAVIAHNYTGVAFLFVPARTFLLLTLACIMLQQIICHWETTSTTETLIAYAYEPIGYDAASHATFSNAAIVLKRADMAFGAVQLPALQQHF